MELVAAKERSPPWVVTRNLRTPPDRFAMRKIVPRLLTQTQAASYCGVSVNVFKQACPVPPVNLCERIPRYDRLALDRWIDSLDNSQIVADDGDLTRMWMDAGDSGARAGN